MPEPLVCIGLELITANPETMVGFYRGLLGFEPAGSGLTFGGFTLAMTAPTPSPLPGERGLRRASGLRLLVLKGERAWFDACLERLAAAGVDASRRGETAKGVGIYLRDPDANTVEIATLHDALSTPPARAVELGFASPDPAALAQFYAGLAGTVATQDGDGTFRLTCGAVGLNLFATEPGAANVIIEPPEARTGFRRLIVRGSLPDPIMDPTGVAIAAEPRP